MDIQLNYIEKGSGEPLLFLHGNGEDSTYFVHQIAYFSKSYRVFALDTRGHGRSPRGTADFSIGQFAEDLRNFMDDRNLPKAHILGFSDGGNIALTFALRHPDRVDKLILNGANLFPSGMKPLVHLPILLEYHWPFTSKVKREFLGLMVKEPNIHPDELRNLQIPALVVAGTRDMIKDRHTRLIYNSLPNAHLALLPGDHFIANQESEIFNQAVEHFLQGCYFSKNEVKSS